MATQKKNHNIERLLKDKQKYLVYALNKPQYSISNCSKSKIEFKDFYRFVTYITFVKSKNSINILINK